MSDARLKGQETEVMLIMNGQVQNTVTDVRSFEMGVQMEIIKEGYLGEKTDRRDDVFRGTRGRMELHYENKDVFDVIQAIVDRATRQSPGTKINVKTTLNFPNGQRKLVMLQDVYFGEIPLNFASRSDYGTVGLEFESANFKFI